jgi:hypothetical protein
MIYSAPPHVVETPYGCLHAMHPEDNQVAACPTRSVLIAVQRTAQQGRPFPGHRSPRRGWRCRPGHLRADRDLRP